MLPAIKGADDQLVVNLGDGGNGIERQWANAWLIQAAPELLDGCKAALAAFERNDAINWDDLRRAIEKAQCPPSNAERQVSEAARLYAECLTRAATHEEEAERLQRQAGEYLHKGANALCDRHDDTEAGIWDAWYLMAKKLSLCHQQIAEDLRALAAEGDDVHGG